MKITCNDGIVRRFNPAQKLWKDRTIPYVKDGECTHCGEKFGTASTEEQKPMWKAHACKIEIDRPSWLDVNDRLVR